MRDKSAEPYEMEKSREGSGSKNIQIKERRVFQVERHQTGKITTGTRESLAGSKLGEYLGSKLPGSTSSRSVVLIWRHSGLSKLCGTALLGSSGRG